MNENGITRRWAKPVIPLALEDVPSMATVLNGREVLEVKARFTPDDIERFRLGYVCMNCFEPHESPFPEKCSLCGYAMRDEQPKEFQRAFRGAERDPRAVRIEQELDRVDDTHERRFHTTKTGIIVPRPV